jgi:signal transduction histidine kinase
MWHRDGNDAGVMRDWSGCLAERIDAWGHRLHLEPLDLWFLGLRIATLAAGVVWCAVGAFANADVWPVTQHLPILAAFFLFSVALYVVNARTPGHIVLLYRVALVFDLGVVFFLVRMTGGYSSEIYLAFVLLVALHAFYFGISTGILAGSAAAALYAAAVEWPPPMPGFGLRLAFFGLVGLCMGVLAEQAHSRQRALERQHDQLLRSDRLATVGELAVGLAHELRNPLAGMAGALHVLEDELAPADDRRGLLADVQAQIVRMNKTLTDLLQHVRPARPQRIAVDINGLVDQSLRFIPRNDVDVVRRYDRSLPPVWVDPSLIHQALLNMLVNARQAMPQGGRLTIETRLARGLELPVEVVIQDTGTGISPEHLGRVFQPFFTTKAQGTGLGLAIAARIVGQHGGRVSVESEIGTGSIFTVALPPAPPPAPRSEGDGAENSRR